MEQSAKFVIPERCFFIEGKAFNLLLFWMFPLKDKWEYFRQCAHVHQIVHLGVLYTLCFVDFSCTQKQAEAIAEAIMQKELDLEGVKQNG